MKKKVRDGQCHYSVCDQLRVGDPKISFYGEDDSANSGKSCKCNKVVISKVYWMLSQFCFQCEILPDSIITDKNRVGNFYWYTKTEKKYLRNSRSLISWSVIYWNLLKTTVLLITYIHVNDIDTYYNVGAEIATFQYDNRMSINK
jgi:hypothetical protein